MLVLGSKLRCSCINCKLLQFAFTKLHPNIHSMFLCRNDPQPLLATSKNTGPLAPDMLFCTQDMCPVKIHWHIKLNYQDYWRVKITITNRDLSRNYTLWNMVAQHPNFENFTEAFSFSYKALNPYGDSSSKFPQLTYLQSVMW